MRTFEKVYRDRDIGFSVHAPEGLRFRGESQDLTDLVGNLLDNSGKWAKTKVDVSAFRDAPADASHRNSFVVCIDDDGPGLDAKAREAALLRGQKLDESRPGSGLGL